MADDFETDALEYEEAVRAKYSADDLKDLQSKGKAMPPSSPGGDPSYPIADQEDLEKAIKAVGRGNASHNAIRKHIIAQAKKLGLSKLIPDNWNADGSLKATNSANVVVDEAIVSGTSKTTQSGRAVTPLAKTRTKKPRHRSGPTVGVEYRHFAVDGLEVRSAKDNSDTIEITGNPIVYNTPYLVRDMFGEFQETMAPGVASNALASGADVRFLFNHEGLPLARTVSGTLRFDDGPEKLNFTASLDARQQIANDLAIAIERRDVTQMSCGFVVADDQWNASMDERTVYRFSDLLDVSAVTYPASPTTDIQVAQRMMLEVPVESRARVRGMWTITRDLKEGRPVDTDAINTLAAGLSALAEVDDEDRAAPTTQDGKVTAKIVDSAPLPDPPVADTEGKVGDGESDDGAGEPDAGPDGTMNSPQPDPATAQDGTGSRSTEVEAATRRHRLELELELAQHRRARHTA